MNTILRMAFIASSLVVMLMADVPLLPVHLVPEAEARRRLESLRERLENKADFAELARLYSEDASGAKGGDLGWFVPEQYGTQFGVQLSSLSDGQVSEPFRSDAGWHIIQRVATPCRPGGCSFMMVTSRSPNTVRATVRGMGVAVITR